MNKHKHGNFCCNNRKRTTIEGIKIGALSVVAVQTVLAALAAWGLFKERS